MSPLAWPRRLLAILAALGLLQAVKAIPPEPAALDRNLPADHLEQILVLIRREHPHDVIASFTYSEPDIVRLLLPVKSKGSGWNCCPSFLVLL